MDLLAEIRRPIEEELRDYRHIFEQTLQTDNSLLQMALNHLLKRQGKMMRPILVLLVARYVGQDGPMPQSVLHAAVSLELLHTASLVHDDVVDESDRRRGQKSVNALLDNKAAVLVGDFLLSKALFHAAQTGSQQVVTWVSELGQTLSDGELHQLANLDKTEVSEDDYFEVIRKKTASLFETCALAGALLGGGEPADIDRMARFGRSLGLCFQMRDDLLDFDNQHDTGKPAGNDLKEGKLTLPVIHALLTGASKPMMDLAIKVRRGEALQPEIDRLLTYTLEKDGIEYTKKYMYKIESQANGFLIQHEGREDVTQSLVSYLKFVVGRDV